MSFRNITLHFHFHPSFTIFWPFKPWYLIFNTINLGEFEHISPHALQNDSCQLCDNRQMSITSPPLPESVPDNMDVRHGEGRIPTTHPKPIHEKICFEKSLCAPSSFQNPAYHFFRCWLVLNPHPIAHLLVN